MLNRRHIRIKVMQSLYALQQSGEKDIPREKKFLQERIYKLYHLYAVLLNLPVAIRNLAESHQEIAKKNFLATAEDINPNKKFVNNTVLKTLHNNRNLAEYCKENKIDYWQEDTEYVRLLWNAIKESDTYKRYMQKEHFSKKEDLAFITEIYQQIIAPDEKLYDYLISKELSWTDDFPFVNTFIVRNLGKIRPFTDFNSRYLYKNEDDAVFAENLFKETLKHREEFFKDIDAKTPNWDTDRIADIDFILLTMALTEFVYFDTIPTRVTINEYIEIAKDYSTPKSSFFINGVLDKLLKEYKKANKITKSGRGLL
ncbi:MAG: transcription antitermination factor NusB [Flavobacteriales bacterium]|nr:MAG: transcription antitermination factor NusB [Flavobacteriales bacterium]